MSSGEEGEVQAKARQSQGEGKAKTRSLRATLLLLGFARLLALPLP
jgi:hypothetical protein